jgi:putative nucleotidyltransferase with HDIG domain
MTSHVRQDSRDEWHDYGDSVVQGPPARTSFGSSGGWRRLRAFGSVLHLAGRFFGSLSPAGPSPADSTWAEGALSGPEWELFCQMSGPDRRHAVAVAREALRLAQTKGISLLELPDGFVPAALLHDVGKVRSRLGTFGRVLATVLAIAIGRRRILSWKGRTGSQFANYLAHDRLGAELLEAAGSHQLTIDWAREHHLPQDRWQVDGRLARCLKEADGD